MAKHTQKEEITTSERNRRSRVVQGWRFEGLSPKKQQAIEAYLDGGPVPEDYIHMDRALSYA